MESLYKVSNGIYNTLKIKDTTKYLTRRTAAHAKLSKIRDNFNVKINNLKDKLAAQEQNIVPKKRNLFRTKGRARLDKLRSQKEFKIREQEYAFKQAERDRKQKLWEKSLTQAHAKILKNIKKQQEKETNKWEREAQKEYERRLDYIKWRGTDRTRNIRSKLERKLNTLTKGKLTTKLHKEFHKKQARDYIIENTLRQKTNFKLFMAKCKPEVFKVFLENGQTKITLVLKLTFERWDVENNKPAATVTTHFRTEQFLNNNDNFNLEEMFTKSVNKFIADIDNFMREGSGWYLKEILALYVETSKHNPLNGSAHLKLPDWLKNKNGLNNITNKDDLCLKWAITRFLNPTTNHPEKVSTLLKQQAEQLNWQNIKFPATLYDLNTFERNNPAYRVAVYTASENQLICPLRFPQKTSGQLIRLFLYSNGTTSHYMPITNLSRLCAAQLGKNHNKSYICDRCLYGTSSKNALENHERYCANFDYTKTVFPEKGNNILKFTNWAKTVRHPIAVYADFECATTKIEQKKGNNTTLKQKHLPTGFHLTVVRFDGKNQNITYTGEDVTDVFVNKVEKICKDWYNEFKTPVPLIKTPEMLQQLADATTCYACGEQLNNDPEDPISSAGVLDHDHFTGELRGIAHSKCNLAMQHRWFVPVFFHNLAGYDEKLFLRKLGESVGQVNIIPKNEESFISLSKMVTVGTKKVGPKYSLDIKCEARFLDTFKFMNKSLETLVKNLPVEKFKLLKSEFTDVEQQALLLRKGVYPYDYVDDITKLDETQLPPKDAFYSELTEQHITDEDYQHAQNVWKTFNCKTLRDYHNLYVKTDVLQLADVFEEFRTICLDNYKLDPAAYYTAPGLAWDAALKHSKIELELFTEEQSEMYLMIEAGIRGGVSMITHRYAEANNKYMSQENYDPTKPESFIIYLDANNLYGWAMSQPLPTGNFKWLTETELQNWQELSSQDGKGCTLEVDLHYPKELHDRHNDLPLAPECFEMEGSGKRLVPHLGNRTRYCVHHKALKNYLDHGMVLTKIHKGISYDEKPWLKSYIELNTNLRTVSKNEFEKEFFKLMNNSVFGKTMENIRNRVNIKIGTNDNFEKLVKQVTFKSRKMLTENMSIIHMRKLQMTVNKPIYVGQSILDLSKTLMYDFHYNYILAKYPQAQLLFTDTDSLCYHIKTKDFYQEIKPDLDLFDTSNYDKNHELFSTKNKKVIGKFKDESGGKQIIKFCGLRSKMYSYLMDNSTCKKEACTNFKYGSETVKCSGNNSCYEVKKCKGIKESTVTRKMEFKNYVECLKTEKPQTQEMCNLRSYNHNMYLEQISKVALSANDTKRIILPDGIGTISHGSWRHIPSQNMILEKEMFLMPKKNTLFELALNKLKK